MTRDKLLEFVGTLGPSMQQVYHLAEEYVKTIDDTLDDEWQLAAEIVAAFEDRAEVWLKRQERP